MICEWSSSPFPQNSFSPISFIIPFYSLIHPPLTPISTPSPSSPLIPAFHYHSHLCSTYIHIHLFPSHSSSQPLKSHSLLSISIPILSFHSIASFSFIYSSSFDSTFSYFQWLPALHYPSLTLISSIPITIPITIPVFSILYILFISFLLRILVSQLWDLYHVCSDSRYRMFICCVDRKHYKSIRRNRFCVWWLIREQQHRMMRKWENGYLRIGGNRCSWSSDHRSRYPWIIEGYLHQPNIKSILSKITDPIFSKFS